MEAMRPVRCDTEGSGHLTPLYYTKALRDAFYKLTNQRSSTWCVDKCINEENLKSDSNQLMVFVSNKK